MCQAASGAAFNICGNPAGKAAAIAAGAVKVLVSTLACHGTDASNAELALRRLGFSSDGKAL